MSLGYFFLTSFVIFPKSGYSASLAAVNLVPFAGQFAVLFILAFMRWPIHEDYNKLKQHIDEMKE